MAPLKVGDSLPQGVKFEYVGCTTPTKLKHDMAKI
jgi:hypothetical protein